MAGDWIKMRTDLATDPAVIAIASALGLEEDAVVGKLHRLWSWADQQTEDGNGRGVTETWIDRYIGVSGFALEMHRAGWLTVSNGGVSFPKFEKHNGKTGKARALTANRVSKKRKRECNAANVTRSSLLSTSSLCISLEELPEEIRTKEFADLWQLWRKHRTEIKHPLNATSEAASLKKLAKLGLERAIAMVEHTLEKGWQGLREPDDDGRPRPQKAKSFTFPEGWDK